MTTASTPSCPVPSGIDLDAAAAAGTGVAPLTSPVLVLGVGNILWADEGFGVRCAESFDARFAGPPNLAVVDGGTQGLYLVDLFRDHPHVILFDCVDFGGVPGEMFVKRGDEVPAFVGRGKVSLHQTGVQDVLATADLLGARPEKLTLIGVQPEMLEDYGGSLRPCVRAMIAPALEVARAELAAWGITLTERAAAGEGIGTAPLAIELYESGRPPAHDACRFGDERVLTTIGLPDTTASADRAA